MKQSQFPPEPLSLRAGLKTSPSLAQGLRHHLLGEQLITFSHHTTLDPSPFEPLTSPPLLPFFVLPFPEEAVQAGTGWPSPHTAQASISQGLRFPDCTMAMLTQRILQTIQGPVALDGERLSHILP